MLVREFCKLNVICCDPETGTAAVASLMRHHHVGDVVVVLHNDEGVRIPSGILTDRDMLLATTALDIETKLFTASDLMTVPVVTVFEDMDILEALRIMRISKVRRLPVVTRSGALFGIISADDIINLLANELSLIAAVMAEQTVKERHLRK